MGGAWKNELADVFKVLDHAFGVKTVYLTCVFQAKPLTLQSCVGGSCSFCAAIHPTQTV